MMTPQNKNEFFADMIQKIQEQIELHAVILFGSRAKGTDNFYIDFDLVIIGDFKIPYIDRIKLILKYTPPVPVDLFCYTPKEFNKMFHSYHLTAIDAIGEGIILFGDEFVRPYKEQYDIFIKKGMRKTDCVLIPPTFRKARLGWRIKRIPKE